MDLAWAFSALRFLRGSFEALGAASAALAAGAAATGSLAFAGAGLAAGGRSVLISTLLTGLGFNVTSENP